MNALSGTTDFQTLKLRWFANKKPIIILVDSGSTHNFLDHTTARQVESQITHINPLYVTVVDGTKMCSKVECKDFNWVVHGKKFCTACRLLPIGGCDVVLGLLWLKGLVLLRWISTNYK